MACSWHCLSTHHQLFLITSTVYPMCESCLLCGAFVGVFPLVSFPTRNRVYTDSLKTAKIHRLKREGEQERAQLMVASANQSARAERELNDYVAHEVRNPLAAAISAHSFVRAQVHVPEPLSTEESQLSVQEDVAIIGNSLHFINDLLRSMLDTSRASTNRMVIGKKPTDISSDVLEPIRSMLYLRDCKVNVIVECFPKDMVILADGLRLKQVVLNLARNSSKFVHHGFIRLKAGIRPDNQTIQISIEDSGPGIPPEKRVQLFSKFQSSLDSLNQGTGIGLSLSKKLVDLMGMDLWLDEEFDSGFEGNPGARFVIDTNLKCEQKVTLPEEENNDRDVEYGSSLNEKLSLMDESSQSLLQSGAFDPESPGSGLFVGGAFLSPSHDGAQDSKEEPVLPPNLRVLFVDDDMILRKLFARTIRKVAPDWQIQEASNGETALKLVEEQSSDDDKDCATPSAFDLIFVDQYMASVEQQLLGTETTRILRSRGVTSVICGLSANDVRLGFQEAGADSFIFKPFATEAKALRQELWRVLASAEDRVHLLEQHALRTQQENNDLNQEGEEDQELLRNSAKGEEEEPTSCSVTSVTREEDMDTTTTSTG